MLRILVLLLAALALLSGPAAAHPPPLPATGQPVPAEWALEADGSVTIRFATVNGVDPDLLARMDAALLLPAFPVIYWTNDGRGDHLTFSLPPPPEK